METTVIGSLRRRETVRARASAVRRTRRRLLAGPPKTAGPRSRDSEEMPDSAAEDPDEARSVRDFPRSAYTCARGASTGSLFSW